MESLGCFALLVLCAVALGAWLLSLDNERRRRVHDNIVAQASQESEADNPEADASDLAAFWLAVEDIFPYLPRPKPKDETPDAIGEAISETLGGVPSLGTFGAPPFPAPALPAKERQRHLYVVGKTGAGKTTFLEHLIVQDLEAGRGVGVIGPERALFPRLLALVPKERWSEVIYFAPGNPACPVALNPLEIEAGDDRSQASEDLFTIFRRSLSDDELGPRMQPILQNGFAVLVGRPGATLFDLKRLLEDEHFRYEVAHAHPQPYVRDFWLETYPRYPKGADLPILNRLDQFLRPAAVARAVGQPHSSFSVRKTVADGAILFLDLSGIPEEPRLLLGQLVLAKFGLELLRRELAPGAPAKPFFLACDEFQATGGAAEGLWRELLSRGRQHGLALTLASQYPAQLPTALVNEIFGNVNSLVAFALGAKDANLVRRELLGTSFKKGQPHVEPIKAEELLELPVGQAYGKLAGGRAVKLTIPAPLPVPDPKVADEVIRLSWQRYGATAKPAAAPAPPRRPKEPESFLE